MLYILSDYGIGEMSTIYCNYLVLGGRGQDDEEMQVDASPPPPPTISNRTRASRRSRTSSSTTATTMVNPPSDDDFNMDATDSSDEDVHIPAAKQKGKRRTNAPTSERKSKKAKRSPQPAPAPVPEESEEEEDNQAEDSFLQVFKKESEISLDEYAQTYDESLDLGYISESDFDVSGTVEIPKAPDLADGNEEDDLSDGEDEEGEGNDQRYYQVNHLKANAIKTAAIVAALEAAKRASLKKRNKSAATVVGRHILAEEDLQFSIPRAHLPFHKIMQKYGQCHVCRDQRPGTYYTQLVAPCSGGLSRKNECQKLLCELHYSTPCGSHNKARGRACKACGKLFESADMLHLIF